MKVNDADELCLLRHAANQSEKQEELEQFEVQGMK